MPSANHFLNEANKSLFELTKLTNINNDIATEAFNLLAIPTIATNKFTAYISDVLGFFQTKTRNGFIKAVTLNTADNKNFRYLKEILDEYQYMSLKDLVFTSPTGLSVDYETYVAFMQSEISKLNTVFSTSLPLVMAIIGDCLNKPDKYSGTTLIPTIPVYEKTDFDKGYRHLFERGQNRKLKWSQITKSNKGYLNAYEAFAELACEPIVRDYTDTLVTIQKLQDKVSDLLVELKSQTSIVSLSSKNIATLSNAILTLARATDAYAMLTIIINDFTFILQDNINQIKQIAGKK